MSLPTIAQMSVEELAKLNPALATLLAQKHHAIKHRDLKIAPLTPEHRLEELLPHAWKPADAPRVH